MVALPVPCRLISQGMVALPAPFLSISHGTAWGPRAPRGYRAAVGAAPATRSPRAVSTSTSTSINASTSTSPLSGTCGGHGAGLEHGVEGLLIEREVGQRAHGIEHQLLVRYAPSSSSPPRGLPDGETGATQTRGVKESVSTQTARVGRA